MGNRKTTAGGHLFFPSRIADPWQFFTLEFSPPDSGLYYLVCEALGSPPLSPPGLFKSADLADATRGGQRYFSLPRQWELVQADWSPPTFTGNGRFEGARGRIYHTLSPPESIGTRINPIPLVLDPHWKFIRFEYFDRQYGKDNHRRRISIPAIGLEGFRTDARAAGSPPDTHSNWTAGGDSADLLQCLPWILRRKIDGNEMSPPLRGSEVGLRFRMGTDPARVPVVYSQDENTRVIQYHSPPSDPPVYPPRPLDPGPARLRYYDLPRIWKSRNYFARGVPDSPPAPSPPPGQFFQDLNVADLARSDNRATPLIFSLDDIVLTDHRFQQLPLGPNEILAVLCNTFANRRLSPPDPAPTIPNLSNEGVYMPGSPPRPEGYPYSRIHMRNRHYLTDYPDWTRLVVAQGNLFDVFADRTSDDPANSVVGARAAVRWVNATTVAPINAAPASVLTWHPFFSIQPFYLQRFLSRNHNPVVGPILYDEWAAPHASGATVGRYDIAHVRCCDISDGEEVAVLLRYHRFDFDFANTSEDPDGNVLANPLNAASVADRMDWVRRVIVNVPNRWNSIDTYNPARAWIRPSPPSIPIRSHVLTLAQYLSGPRAHFLIRSADPAVTSWMSTDGDGQLRVNAVEHDDGAAGGVDAWGIALEGRGLAAAHEVGHCGSMPDDYRPGGLANLNYRSNHALGNPYALEDRSLMLFNWFIRARYFWHAAEWLRTLPGLGAQPFIIQHTAAEYNYSLPFYRHAGANPGRNYVSWPIRFNLRQRPPGGANTCFDSVLYLLGEDEYARNILPDLVANNTGAARVDGDQMDGILVVMVRMRVRYTNFPAAPANLDSDVRNDLYRRMQRRFDDRLNGRFCARFAVSTGSNSAPAMRRCLLYFLPCFTTEGAPGEAANTAASLPHLRVRVRWTGADNFVDAAPPNPKSQDLGLADLTAMAAPARVVEMNRIADLLFGACCRALGLTNNANAAVAGSYANPNSHVDIVRTVMDAAAPNPVIT